MWILFSSSNEDDSLKNEMNIYQEKQIVNVDGSLNDIKRWMSWTDDDYERSSVPDTFLPMQLGFKNGIVNNNDIFNECILYELSWVWKIFFFFFFNFPRKFHLFLINLPN